MKTDGLNVLLIEPVREQSEHLTGILMDLGYQVLRAENPETAIHKIVRHSPDAIICQKNLNEDSGFLFFSMLRNKFSRAEMPFILLLNNFNEKDLSLGFEIGIDSFLYPPFESKKISNTLDKQLQKRQNKRINTVSQFKSFFDATPFGFFVCRNSVITDTNKLFFKLVKTSQKVKGKMEITDIFNFGSNASDEINLLRCLNGISSYCSFRSIPLVNDSGTRFNVFLNVVENEGTFLRIAGLVIPENNKYKPTFNFNKMPQELVLSENAKNELSKTNGTNLFTQREKQVLKLSAEGAPVKQIAHQMGISVRPVEKHRSNIFRKTNSGNIVEAVFYANKKHLLESN